MSLICQIYACSLVHEDYQDCGMPQKLLRKRFSPMHCSQAFLNIAIFTVCLHVQANAFKKLSISKMLYRSIQFDLLVKLLDTLYNFFTPSKSACYSAFKISSLHTDDDAMRLFTDCSIIIVISMVVFIPMILSYTKNTLGNVS